MLIDEHFLEENFQDVENKAFDRDMGFGYISDNGYNPKARVILQGENPFIQGSIFQAFLSPILGGHLPYSQVYQLTGAGEEASGGRTFCIMR